MTEHRLLVLHCARCGKTTEGEYVGSTRFGVRYGAGVKARVLYLQQYQLLPYARTAEAMRNLFGCRLSPATVANMVRECAAGLAETELKIKRGLPRYRGRCVHDGLRAYTDYEWCRHALCGVHLLRELTYFEELSEETKAWADPLRELLLGMKCEAERGGAKGEKRLAPERLADLTWSYDRLVAAGLEAQPPPDVPEQIRKQAHNLLLRMGRRKDEVLRFMSDFAVPFDNNQLERDLPMIKLQQKVGGCFRSEEGAMRFCRIRSYVSTMRKQGRAVIGALEGACRGKPLSLRMCAR